MARLHSISVRLILAIAGIGISAALLLGTFSVLQQESFSDLALEQTLKLQFESVAAAFEYEARTARIVAATVATLPGLVDAAEHEDRDALTRIVGPTFAALDKQGVPLLNVMRPPAINIFRAHDLKSFGDDVSARRTTVVQANREHIAIQGVEADRVGVSVFGMVPISRGDQHVGLVDAGIRLGNAFVERAKQRFGVDLAVHRVDGDQVTTLSATFPEKTTALPGELKRAQEGAQIQAHRMLGNRPVVMLLGQVKNYAGEPVAVLELVKDNSVFAAVGAQARQRLMLATLAILVASVLLGLFMARGMSRPIMALTGAMNRLSGGDTEIAVPGLRRKDELGLMARAVQVFKDNAIAVRELRREQEAAAARAQEEKRASLARLADNFEASVGSVAGAVSAAAAEMQATAGSMSAAADQAMQRSVAAGTASTETSANVQTVAAATEELSTSIGEISQQVTEASRIAGQAMEQAQATNTTVQNLAATADRIGAVVALINDIASQTNLLALNATIEAARAGEAGKGFAVVASEVKTLAGQTAKATDEIASQVAAIQSETKQAVTAIEAICTIITGVNSISSSIAAAVEQQGAATHEIARNIQQAASGTAAVSDNITGVTGAVGDTGAAAQLVLGSAAQLAKQSVILRAEVDRFLGQVRTG